MVVLNEHCENVNPHMFHEVTRLRTKTCSGMSECGLYLHDPHDMEVEIMGWCPGICDCGLRGGISHGPGDHK